MPGSRSRVELLTRLDETLRKVGAHSVLLSDTVARLVGITSTDLECLDLILLAGATTPGWLARQTGLTTGTMTVVIDRLERAGFVRRSRDSADRRRVRVEVVPARLRRIAPLYERLAQATSRLNAGYQERELEVVADYLTRALDLVAEHVAWLQTQQPLAKGSGARHRPPRGRSVRRRGAPPPISGVRPLGSAPGRSIAG